jgi:hypothetical protein
MAASTLTSRETRDLQVFINAAYERDPGAGRAVAVREGTATWREWRKDGGGPSVAAAPARRAAPRLTAAQQGIVSEAVATAVAERRAARKAAKKARKQARETAARVQLAEQFSEPVVGRSLRESSRQELADVALAGLGFSSQTPFGRANPGGAVTEEGAAAGRLLEARLDPPGYRRQLAESSPDDLRRHLGARLTVLGDASDLHSPFWRPRPQITDLLRSGGPASA